MNISDSRRPWVPACATNIRATFANAMKPDGDLDWKARKEGALEVMRKLAESPSNVVRLRK